MMSWMTHDILYHTASHKEGSTFWGCAAVFHLTLCVLRHITLWTVQPTLCYWLVTPSLPALSRYQCTYDEPSVPIGRICDFNNTSTATLCAGYKVEFFGFKSDLTEDVDWEIVHFSDESAKKFEPPYRMQWHNDHDISVCLCKTDLSATLKLYLQLYLRETHMPLYEASICSINEPNLISIWLCKGRYADE